DRSGLHRRRRGGLCLIRGGRALAAVRAAATAAEQDEEGEHREGLRRTVHGATAWYHRIVLSTAAPPEPDSGSGSNEKDFSQRPKDTKGGSTARASRRWTRLRRGSGPSSAPPHASAGVEPEAIDSSSDRDPDLRVGLGLDGPGQKVWCSAAGTRTRLS